MATALNKKKKQTDSRKEQSAGKKDKNTGTPQDVGVETESAETPNPEEVEGSAPVVSDEDPNETNAEEGSDPPKVPEPRKPPGAELKPDVTLEPQNDEQADLRLFKNGVEISYVSVPVDDDSGQWIDDLDVFKGIKDFIRANQCKKGDELKDPNLLKNGTELASEFNEKIFLQEAISLGMVNKYRILLGKILIILKAALKQQNENKGWMDYYDENFSKSTQSSAIKYMKLARIPNIIRWSFLGLERLESIVAIIKGTDISEESDPIAAFFNGANISVDLKDKNFDEFRYAIDTAVLQRKIAKYFDKKNEEISDDKKVKNNVDGSLIHDLVRAGKKIDSSLITDLYHYAKDGADPNTILNHRIETGGNSTSSKEINDTLTDIKTIEGFPKIISELKSKVNYLSNHTDLLKKVSPQHVEDLEEQVNALKNLVRAQVADE